MIRLFLFGALLMLPLHAADPFPVQEDEGELQHLVKLADALRPLIPPYVLSETTYLNFEVAYAPLRYLPGKALSLLNWESTLVGFNVPSEASRVEAQLYGGYGHNRLFGEDSVAEFGMALNDLRGPSFNFLMRKWIFKDLPGWGNFRLTTHAQMALPVWGDLGYSSLALLPRWETPAWGGRFLSHLSFIWCGSNRLGTDQDDEWYWGTAFRYPDMDTWSGLLMVGGFATVSSSRTYVAPSVIFRFSGAALSAGMAFDLTPSAVHVFHLGLHTYGEPK